MMQRTTLSRFETYGPAVFIWAIVVFAGLIKSGTDVMRGTLPGNDDYMRIVQIRDLLGGQAWGDPLQTRMFPADPLVSHWARLSDVLIGGLIKLFTPVFGAAGAETAALFVFPALLLLITIGLVVKIAVIISDAEWVPLTAAITAGLCYPVFYQFFPGRIDHHGLQIVFALLAAFAIIRAGERPSYGILAGGLCGLSFWVGIESAPYVAAACAAISVNWALSKDPKAARALMLFGLSLAAVTAVCLLISPAQSRIAAACDAISPVFAVLSAAIAVAMVAAALLSPRLNSAPVRLAVVSALGLLAAGVTLALYPHCLRGPYAQLDPRLVEVWLSNVSEAKPFHKGFTADIMVSLSMLAVPVLALFGLMKVGVKSAALSDVTAHRAARTLLIFMALTALTGLIQTRMFSFAGALGAPLAAVFIAHMAGQADRFKSDLSKALARVSVLTLLSPLMIPALINAAIPTSDIETQAGVSAQDEAVNPDLLTCDVPAALSGLNTLPTGLVITQIDLGAPLLAAGPHSATTAPYHRNEAGLMAAIDIYMRPAAEAKPVAVSLDADYLIVCPDMPETNLFSKMEPDGLLANLIAGETPTWLQPIDLPALASGQDNPLLAYRVLAE